MLPGPANTPKHIFEALEEERSHEPDWSTGLRKAVVGDIPTSYSAEEQTTEKTRGSFYWKQARPSKSPRQESKMRSLRWLKKGKRFISPFPGSRPEGSGWV